MKATDIWQQLSLRCYVKLAFSMLLSPLPLRPYAWKPIKYSFCEKHQRKNASLKFVNVSRVIKATVSLQKAFPAEAERGRSERAVR